MNVYDFDDTIYNGESAFDFFLDYIKINPSMIKLLPTVIRTLTSYKAGKISNDEFLARFAPDVKKYYCEYPHWDEFTRKFWDEHMGKIRSFYFRTRKPDDCIVTASPDLTVKEISKRLGVHNYVCSIVNGNGEIERLCMREKKEQYFRESFPDAVIEDFYTDSIENDGFFANSATRVFLVRGNDIKLLG